MPKIPQQTRPHPGGPRINPDHEVIADRVADLDNPPLEQTDTPAKPASGGAARIIADGDKARALAGHQVDAALSRVSATPKAKATRKARLTELPQEMQKTKPGRGPRS